MGKYLQAIRGMNDTLPEHTSVWAGVEAAAQTLLTSYGYREIRLPLVEKTELFVRSIGAMTDVVEKEMYTFIDRNGDSLTLRPEGTAGCVRACVEHGLLHNQIQRLWYMGPMFRHEKPQKGRYRQFHQIGVEAYGIPGPDIDAELIFMTARLWKQLGISTDVALQINSLGSVAARAVYRERLVAYFKSRWDELDEDSQRRLDGNPLRILDTKNPAMASVVTEAPLLLDYLDAESQAHFNELQQFLDANSISYTINPLLVRGLDYYNKTVFEWVTGRLGAQGTVCAGGRYDDLVEQLGGRFTPAVGFALGLERLIHMLLQAGFKGMDDAPHVYLVLMGEAAEHRGRVLAETLREHLPLLRIQVNCGGGGFKTQFKRADRSQARLALILGEDEVREERVTVKLLREDSEQMAVSQAELAAFLQTRLFANN